MDSISYQQKPISSIKALSGLLQIPEIVLLDIAARRDQLYQQNKPEIKPNGKERITYRLDKKLKFIQKKINKIIFGQVYFPLYLQGSIKDRVNPRSYDTNANLHAGSNFIISEDVSDFFPSIAEKHVLSMWKHLFHFSPDVADILTRLTTYNGAVPQGGVTSSYLANLILWDIEPKLVKKLRADGITYTRYIDDVTLSSNEKFLPQDKVEAAIKSVYVMLKKKGLTPNRRKHKIMGGSDPVVIHKLNVNSGRATMSRKKRDDIRAEIFSLKKLAVSSLREGDEYRKRYSSVTGKVRSLSKFHKALGDKYFSDLKEIPPM